MALKEWRVSNEPLGCKEMPWLLYYAYHNGKEVVDVPKARFVTLEFAQAMADVLNSQMKESP